jgi:hypothetical protein
MVTISKPLGASLLQNLPLVIPAIGAITSIDTLLVLNFEF